jgi:hypothetical protein
MVQYFFANGLGIHGRVQWVIDWRIFGLPGVLENTGVSGPVGTVNNAETHTRVLAECTAAHQLGDLYTTFTT